MADRGAEGAFRDALLSAWGIPEGSRREFVSPTLSDLVSAPLPPGGEACVGRLAAAAAAEESVALFGDGDIDGCLGVAILEATLTRLGAVVHHAFDLGSPQDGPGLRLEPLEPALAAGAGLVVTVDCAVRHDGVAETLAERGVEVWVTDHHPPPPGPTDRTVNPLLPGADFPSLCGAGVALRLALALDADPAGVTDALAACLLATIGDAVPLVGENRTIAKLGLAAWRRTSRPVFAALRKPAKRTLDGEVWALRRGAVAPLNAAPRYGDAESCVSSLLCSDPAEARGVVERVTAANRRRKKEMRGIFSRVPATPPGPPGRVAAVVAPEVPPTHVSLVAGRLVQELGRPVVVFGRPADGKVRGSARSPDGHPLRDLAKDSLGDLALDLGGHALAFGLTVAERDCAEAARRLGRLRLPPPVGVAAIDSCGLPPSAALAVVDSLGPYGPGFARPVVGWPSGRPAGPGRAVVGGEEVAVTVDACEGPVAAVPVARNGEVLLRIIPG